MDVVDLIRRAGYPYDTPGAFYAAAIRYFTVYLVGGAIAAGVLAMLGLGAAAPFIAAGMIYMGLTRPYANLRSLAKKRAEAVRNNMLLGLSVFESLLADMGPTNALQKVSTMGGPFCNLLMLYVSRSGDPDVVKNINIVRAHVPDPADINMMLFLRDLQDHFVNGRTILESVAALRVSVQREILEATEKRTSLILQRTSLFGIFSVVGLILSLILPFMMM